MKLERFVQTLPLAVGLQAVQVPAALATRPNGEATVPYAEAPAPADAAGTDGDVFIAPSEPEISKEIVMMKVDISTADDSWVDTYGTRYEELVEKEALGTISGSELKSLDALQKVRRRIVESPTTEEVLEQHRREKLDRELLKALKRYVRFQPFHDTKNRT